LRLRRQRHAGGSVGVRVGSALAYVTDSEVDEATIDLARGVDTLLHEVWWTDAEAAAPGFAPHGHSWAGGVADLADRAGVRRLAPVHHHPRRGPEELEALVGGLAAAAACEVLAAEEGREYTAAGGL
jgi:ribonuclease BN (tRNA processing enzyme)